MPLHVTLPGGKAVNALYEGFTIPTDQPEAAGGEGAAPSPFELCLAALGTCAGFFCLRFCQEREIRTEGLHLELDWERDAETRRMHRISIEIHLPEGFPQKYRGAIVRAAEQCSVKKMIQDPPEFDVAAV